VGRTWGEARTIEFGDEMSDVMATSEEACIMGSAAGTWRGRGEERTMGVTDDGPFVLAAAVSGCIAAGVDWGQGGMPNGLLPKK